MSNHNNKQSVDDNNNKYYNMYGTDSSSDDGVLYDNSRESFDNNNNNTGSLPVQPASRYLLPTGSSSEVFDDDACIGRSSYVNVDFKVDQNELSDKCLKLLKDFAIKEKEHITILKIINKEYYEDLLKNRNMHGLTVSDIQTIFKHMKEIYDFHIQLFSRELDDRIKNWDDQPFICDIVVKYMNLFRFYDEFIDHFETSFKCLTDCITQSNQFSEYLNNRSNEIKRIYTKINLNDYYGNSIELKYCLIHVLQWFGCCEKFLEAYLNILTLKSEDHSDASKSWSYFKTLSNKAEEIFHNCNRLLALLDLQKRLASKCYIMDKKRALLKEGQLKHIKKHFGFFENFNIILLNDKLIICEAENNDKICLKFKCEYNLIGIKVFENMSATNRVISLPNWVNEQLMFFVYLPSEKKNFRFVARNLVERNSWLSVFKKAEAVNKYEKDIDRSNIGKVPPKWIPDELCQYCCKCKIEFSTINRRHHCRACGYIFCSKCSKTQANLEYDTSKKSRICDACHDIMFGSFRSGPPSKEELERRLRNNISHS